MGISSRRLVYLMSLTTPTISMSMGVPGSLPKPTRRPRALPAPKNVRANFSFTITTRGTQSSSRGLCFCTSRSRRSKSRPATRGTPMVSK